MSALQLIDEYAPVKIETIKPITKHEAYNHCRGVVNDELAAKVLVDKYFLCNEDKYYESEPAHMWSRLAQAISLVEAPDKRLHWTKQFRDVLDDFKFVPAGRVLYGLGNPYVNVTLKNCYVIAIREDSIKGIFQAAYEMAETYKAGGGCGIDISVLRPKGSIVRNAARESTGSVSFMDFYSHITGMIGQKARIGALLISIDVSHPDVEDFISIKGGDDLDLVRYANVSVKITDKFMQAVNDNKDFDLHWGGNVFKTVKARELWNKLIHYAWKRAEPGLLFWDMICKSVPAHNYDGFKCVTTNPCLTGGMRLLTINGHKTIRELWAEGDFQEYDGEPTIQKHGELKIINSKGIVSATNVYRTSECANIFRVTLKNGIEIDATENHKFILNDGSRKTLAELEIGDELSINQQQVFGNYHYPEYAELAGWVIGDGSLSRNKTGYVCAHITCWNKDIENVLPILREDMLIVYKKSNKSTNQNPEYEGIEKTPKGFNHTEKEICSRLLGRLMEEDGVVPGNKHHVPKSIWNSDKETIAAFLRGFFSADGSVQVNENKKCISIRNCQVNKSILTECQFLLNQFGITSSIFRRREATKKLMNDGKGGMKLYNKKAEHEIIISGRNNCGRFISEIGFIQKWKSLIGLTWIDNHAGSNNSEIKFTSQIKSIEFIGREETYCLTEPENHEITINNIHIAQCGEVSLSDGDSCNLGSMNLGKYVINPFKKAEFDYTSFENDTRLGVRFLDNIISLEKAPLPFQQRANDNGRRLGLGVMGFADMLLKSGIRYDSDQAIALADRVGLSFMRASYSASCDLAEEKGSFPIFDPEIHAKSEYIKRLPDDIKKRINKTGIRNIAVHAIAPTGSLSCIAQCSSAIEPVFMMRHIRKTNLGTAKKVEEHEIFHPVAKAYIEQTGENQLPDYFVSSHQISPDYRIKLQALMNKYIDQSISNTVNLPADTPEEKIAYYYMEAWRQGCKGITVYRDGSREGVLVSAEQKPTPAEITIHSAPKRPLELDANIHVIKPNGKTYTIFIGVLKDRPYEVFALDHKQAGLADGMKGKIIKVNREKPDGDNVYNFESGALLVRQLNRYEGSDVSLITRLISTSLRHGTPLEFLVDQTFKSKDPLASFGRAIARALSLYIKKEDIEGKFKCPKCGGRSIKYEGMCFTCLDCAHSKCS